MLRQLDLTPDQFRALKNVENLPDEFLVNDELCGLMLGGISKWTVARTNPVPKVQISARKSGRRLGDIRRKIRGVAA